MRQLVISHLRIAASILLTSQAAFAADPVGARFTNVTLLNVPAKLSACLSNDGKMVLCLERGAGVTSNPALHPPAGAMIKPTYSYCLLKADGTDAKAVFDTGTSNDYWLGFPSTACVFSCDSKQFLALRIKGQDPAEVDTAVCDLSGKCKLLPRKGRRVHGACFAADGGMYFVDNAPRDQGAGADVNRYDPITGRCETILTVESATLNALTISPDGRRLAAVKSASGSSCLWAYDIPHSNFQASAPVLLASPFWNDAIRLVWSDDSQAIYVGMSPFNRDPAAPQAPPSPAIVEFRPFPAVTQQERAQVDRLIKQLGAADFKDRDAAQAELLKIAQKASEQMRDALVTSDDPEVRSRLKLALSELPPSDLRLLQRGKHLAVLATFGDGRLSVTDAVMVNKMKGQAYVLDPAADKLTPLPLPLVLIDRKAGTALLLDVTTGRYATARLANQ